MQLTAKLQQRLVMNQQLQQAISLLQYNTIELKQVIQQFIETNPLIEVEENQEDSDNEAIDNTYTASISKRNYNTENDDVLENIANPKTLREHLLEQTLLCRFNSVEYLIATTIIDNLDDNGRLTVSLEDIQVSLVDNCSASLDQIEYILKIIQKFDPIGIAARDIRESLLIQLEALHEHDIHWDVAHTILEHHFDKITTTSATKFIKILHVNQEVYAGAMQLIRQLNPNPGVQFSRDLESCIEPEIYVKKIKDKWEVFLSDSLITNIKINSYYRDLIMQSKKSESFNSMSKELQEAQWLLKGIKRRNETLLSVASYIVKLQHAFLDHGHAHMKPMIISDVSSALNIHESTVSRITTGKYMATPWGVYELKYFFPSHVTTITGHACSETTVKEKIKELVAAEKPGQILSDSDIAAKLVDSGINIARRTVAKYRESLKILPSYQRAQILSHQEEPAEIS